ncbi:DUF7573 domain-containing protein [Halopiger xanaduensis]|uniref:DUF7573 domain-containing protein n=1 Tax=Halopiger xanaduensis (strain DSM 18323 / JCM 14033 / SH-6) TaxID=797210 RepID=F8D8V3_HALXS|nr:hypothetical protein [Halopiger xanaduensis]AEH38017.1 hypothetical protein Halxa_3405 [Halopiger xanaduensis SH-6]
MTDDATLSDFADDASDERDDASADERNGSSSDEDAADERDTVPVEHDGTDGTDGTKRARADPNPSLSTYAWGEYVCARCDEESDRVWRDGDEFVCPDCKEW